MRCGDVRVAAVASAQGPDVDIYSCKSGKGNSNQVWTPLPGGLLLSNSTGLTNQCLAVTAGPVGGPLSTVDDQVRGRLCFTLRPPTEPTPPVSRRAARGASPRPTVACRARHRTSAWSHPYWLDPPRPLDPPTTRSATWDGTISSMRLGRGHTPDTSTAGLAHGLLTSER